MTSEERHEARYKRRKAKRDSKRKKVLEEHGDYYQVISRNALSRAAKEAAKGVKYKASVQRFMLRRLTNVSAIHRNLVYHKDIRKGFICFTLMERGKVRKIMSVHFSERVPQKSLNQNALIPVLTRSLIHDNGASRKGMGTGFAMKRLVGHLRWHYRRYGTEGYILLVDFSDYFGSIDHEVAKQIIADAFDDQGIIWLANLFIDAYYEYNVKFKNIPEEEAHKGLGLGSEINQTLAISVPNPMDHYIKEVLRIKCYGRYMDDFYLIHPDKEYLKYCLEQIEMICARLKITVSAKKTKNREAVARLYIFENQNIYDRNRKNHKKALSQGSSPGKKKVEETEEITGCRCYDFCRHPVFLCLMERQHEEKKCQENGSFNG